LVKETLSNMRDLFNPQGSYAKMIGQVINDLKTKVKLILEQRGIRINEEESKLTKD